MTNDCPLKRLTNHWSRWWSVRPLFKSSILVRRLVGEEDARINAVNLLELKPGQRVLDLSCGLGANLRYLQATGAEVVAVDENPENVEAARTEIRANHFLNIRAMSLKDAEQVLEDGSFDAILCTGTFTSSSNPYVCYYNACRWLKPGGLIAAVDYVNDDCLEDQLLFGAFIFSTYMLADSAPNNAWEFGLGCFCDILFREDMQGGISKLVLARKRPDGVVPPPPKRVEIPVCQPRQASTCSCPSLSQSLSSLLSEARNALQDWQTKQQEAKIKAAAEKKRSDELAKAEAEAIAAKLEAEARKKAEAEAKAKAEAEAKAKAEAEAKAKAEAEAREKAEAEAREKAEAEAKAKAEAEAREKAEAEAKAKAEAEARKKAEAEAKAKAEAEAREKAEAEAKEKAEAEAREKAEAEAKAKAEAEAREKAEAEAKAKAEAEAKAKAEAEAREKAEAEAKAKAEAEAREKAEAEAKAKAEAEAKAKAEAEAIEKAEAEAREKAEAEAKAKAEAEAREKAEAEAKEKAEAEAREKAEAEAKEKAEAEAKAKAEAEAKAKAEAEAREKAEAEAREKAEAEAKAKAEAEAKAKAEAEAKAKAEAEAIEKAEAEAKEKAEAENVISAGGRTFNFVPFDSNSYVPKRPPHMSEGKGKRGKKNGGQAVKYSYKNSYQSEPQFAPPSVFKGNSTNIDSRVIKVPLETKIETTEVPYVPPVSVQQAAREKYVIPVEEEVYPIEQAPVEPAPSTAPVARQRMPLLRGGASSLPQQPTLALRAGILHSSRHTQPAAEPPQEAPTPTKKNKRKR